MAISAAGIIFSSLNNNTLSRLTTERTVAAIPFACRYRLVDFALSNLVNANISNISIIANYNYRSLQDHIGSGKDWDLARRAGGINFISPFQTANNAQAKMFSSHMEALKSMKVEYIDQFKEDYVVLIDSDNVLNIDLSEVLAAHEKTGAEVTFVTKTIDSSFTSKNTRTMLSHVAGRVTQIALSDRFDENNPELSLGIYVFNTTYLRKILENAESYNQNSLTQMFLKNCKSDNFRAFNYSGFVASVSSFLDYYKYSMELVNDENARECLLGNRSAPVFTRVNNSAPTIYKSNAKIENSMIADECVIDGTVINSVIFRDVIIEKGAVVKNSVLFHGTRVCKNAELNSIVTDKDVVVTEGVKLSGNGNMPFYIQKRRKV